MQIDRKIQTRFSELEEYAKKIDIIPSRQIGFSDKVNQGQWQKWASSVLNLLSIAFGVTSVHFCNFKKIYDTFYYYEKEFESALGIFLSAKEDYSNGYFVSLGKTISGEIFGDFVVLAKRCLAEENKDVAAVLACAALEDVLKKYARVNELDVDDKEMQQVVSALKSKGLVSGASKSLLDTMPKIRDYAMHANWSKITSADVSSVIGFVDQFLITNF